MKVDLQPAKLRLHPQCRPTFIDQTRSISCISTNLEVDDVNPSLSYLDAGFEMVNIRFINGGINDWNTFIGKAFCGNGKQI